MRNIMEKVKSNKDVILCRGIWYVITLLSIFGLSISLNLVWPPGECSSSSSRFLRDGAVSVTTFYAVMLLRYLFFTDPDPSTYYRDFTPFERLPQTEFTQVVFSVLMMLPTCTLSLFKHEVWFAFVIGSSITGGLGLIQLSDKFRMEIRHALMTFFLFSFTWFSVVFAILYMDKYFVISLFLLIISGLVSCFVVIYNSPKSEAGKDKDALHLPT